MGATDAVGASAERARERPDPTHPVRFWAQIALAPALAAGVMAVLVAVPGIVVRPSGLRSGDLLGLTVAVLLVVAGELWPIFGARSPDPSGVAWSTTFAFAVLIFAGVLPAVVLYAGAAVLRGLLAGQRPFRWLFNAGQYSLSLLSAWAVMASLGARPRLDDRWAPSTLGDLGIVVLAGAAFFVTNELLVAGVVASLTGTSLRTELNDSLPLEVATNGSQLLLAPLVAVIMAHAPMFTVLSVLPVAAIHLTVATSRESERAASHDDLTGLANRKRFVTRTRQAIADSDRSGASTALFLIDLDGFKEVNDVLGHPAGDRALQEVARRLRATVAQADVVARLGGDEFAFVVSNLSGAPAALLLADSVVAALGEQFDLDGQPVDLDGSIGIALAPEHGHDFETLFSRADVAMYAAKRERSAVAVYDVDDDASSLRRVGMLGALRRALDLGELELTYQPKVDLATGEARGVEALVRWRHPSGVIILPDDFIPVAEQSGLMPRLTAEVLEMALSQSAEWLGAGLRVPIAVNVSLRDLLDVDFADTLAARLVRYGIPASLLSLEVTERVLAGNIDRVAVTMSSVVATGVQMSLDDFGTGWSSLLLLRRLPVAEIKLDRSFVSRVADSPADATIVAGVTAMAHALGLSVVAEGVEDDAVWRVLGGLGCDTAQGWHVSRSMTAADTGRWLRQHRRAPVPARPAGA